MITPQERQSVVAVLINGGFTVDQSRVDIKGDRLYFYIVGGSTLGNQAVNGLLNAGLIAVIDEDGLTDENKAIKEAGTHYCECWIQLVDGKINWRKT